MVEATELPISPPPGVSITDSLLASIGRWNSPMDKARFVNGKPQKIGGWVAASQDSTIDAARAVHAWRDNDFNNYFAAGTFRKLWVYDTGWARNDITPFSSTGSLPANPFTTTNLLTEVIVHSVAHGRSPGDTVIFAGAVLFNGVTLNGSYIVQTVIDTDHYTVNALTTATGSGTGGGGAVTFQYELPIGVDSGAYGYGYGVGGYGLGTYGTPRTASTIFIEPRIWSLDHFGQFLIASYNTGTIYIFDPTQAQPWPRAQVISSDPALPTNCRYAFVTQERFVFALCVGMVVQWCSQGNYLVWTPATNNTANARTLQVGTKLVAGNVLGPELAGVWSDAAMYLFQYTGSAFIYNSRVVGKNCGLIAPGAVVSVGGMAFWMGTNNFWMFNGSVVPMPRVEDIRKYVFDNLNQASAYQCNATYNPVYNEIVFHFATGSNTVPDTYVTFHLNVADQCWSFGRNDRTAGSSFDQGDTRPYFASGTNFLIYQHENTYDADGAPLESIMTLAPYALSPGGGQNMQVDYVQWDFFQQAGNINMTLTAYDRVNDTNPTVIETETEVFPPSGGGITDSRIMGRFISISFESKSLGAYWRWGAPVAFVKPRGGRP